MNDDNSDRKSLDRLAKALAEDILEMSDEEILAEFGEQGGDAAQYAAKMRTRFRQTVLTAKKARLENAAGGAAASRRTADRRRRPVDSGAARRRLASALARDSSSPMTLAARKEKDLSDADVQGTLEDLEELGAIDPPDDQESED